MSAIGLVGASSYDPPLGRLRPQPKPKRRVKPMPKPKPKPKAMPKPKAAARRLLAPAVLTSGLMRPTPPPEPGLVSLIVPTLGKRALAPLLAAVEKQTYQHFELVVVKDSERRGAPFARNQGASQARGEFLFFLDDDVILTVGALDVLVRTLEAHPRAAYAYGWFRIDGKIVGRQPFDASKLCRQNFVSTNCLVRASVFPGWDENLRRWQDWELWLRLLGAGKHGVFVDHRIFSTSFDRNGISADAAALQHAAQVLRARHGIRR